MDKKTLLLQDVRRQQNAYELEIKHRKNMVKSALFNDIDISMDGVKHESTGFYRGTIGYRVKEFTPDILETLYDQHIPMYDIVFSQANYDIMPRSIVSDPTRTDIAIGNVWLSVIHTDGDTWTITLNWMHLLLGEHIIIVSVKSLTPATTDTLQRFDECKGMTDLFPDNFKGTMYSFPRGIDVLKTIEGGQNGSD